MVGGRHFSDFLLQQQFKPSAADPCLFVRRRGEEFTILAVYVDDGVLASNQLSAIDDLLDAFKTTFKIRSYPAGQFLGLTITRDRPGRKLFLSQSEYTRSVVEDFHMATCSPKSSPADPNTQLSEPEKNAVLDTNFPYREDIGSLQYLA